VPRIIKRILFVAVVTAVAAAGGLTGRLIRSRGGGVPAVVTVRPPMTLLRAGDIFPDLPLVDDAGERTPASALIGGTGMVVLFLDLECPPCAEMALRWQKAIDEGAVDSYQVMAVTYQSHEAMAAFRGEHALAFPFYRDADLAFRERFDVTRFPLEVVVGASGLIHSTSFDSASPIDAGLLREQLAD